MMGYVQKAQMSAHLAELRAAVVGAKAAITVATGSLDIKDSAGAMFYPVITGAENLTEFDELFAKHFEENLDDAMLGKIQVAYYTNNGENGSYVVVVYYLKEYLKEPYFRYESRSGEETITYTEGGESTVIS